MDSYDVLEQKVSILVQVDEQPPYLSLIANKRAQGVIYEPRLQVATVAGSGSVNLIQARIFTMNSCDGSSEELSQEEDWVALIDASLTDCSPCDRLVEAIKKGAEGAIFINKPGNLQGYPHPLPPQPGRCSRIPKYLPDMAKIGIVSLSDDAAFSFLSSLSANKKARVDLKVTSAFRDFVSSNIIATSRYGNSEEIVLFSSHLDSVPAGPGFVRRLTLV